MRISLGFLLLAGACGADGGGAVDASVDATSTLFDAGPPPSTCHQDTRPCGRFGSALGIDLARDRLLVVGGGRSTPGGFAEHLQDTWAMSLAGDNAWTLLDEEGPGPDEQVLGGHMLDDGSMLVITWDSTFTLETWRMTPGDTSAAWEQLETSVFTVDEPPAFQVHPTTGEAWIVSERDVGGMSFRRFDPATEDWVEMPIDMSPSRQEARAALDPIANKLYVQGGRHLSGTDIQSYDDLWVYDVAAGTWTKLADDIGADDDGLAAYDAWNGRWLGYGYNPEGTSLAIGTLLDLGAGSTEHALVAIDGPTPPGTGPLGVVYDPFGERLLQFGGYYWGDEDEVAHVREVWELAWPPGGTPTWSRID